MGPGKREFCSILRVRSERRGSSPEEHIISGKIVAKFYSHGGELLHNSMRAGQTERIQNKRRTSATVFINIYGGFLQQERGVLYRFSHEEARQEP